MEDTIHVDLVMEQKMCSSCKKSNSEYYELQLQLRYKYYNDEQVMNLKEKTLGMLQGHFETINKVEEIDEGFDIFFRSKGEMNRIYNLFVNKYFVFEKRSAKIMGKDNLKSRNLYRHFQLITLINLGVGDKVSIKGEE